MALACVCFFWGTTYLGIRIALESFSPETLMFLRYTASGGIMLVAALATGARFPSAGEAWRTAIYGAITIGLGTGSLAFAEQWVPSGLAALMGSLSPFWMVGVEALVPGGERLHAPAVRGMLVGLAGSVCLIAPAAFGDTKTDLSGRAVVGGFLLLQFGAAMWAAGSIAQRRMVKRAHPFVSGGVQQLATGLAFAIPALLQGRPAMWDGKGVGAIAYLAMFGGVVGYSAFIFSMDRLPVALVSIYTYINPIVAVLLGWWFYRERFGWEDAVAMAVIFAGVAIVKRSTTPKRSVPIE